MPSLRHLRDDDIDNLTYEEIISLINECNELIETTELNLLELHHEAIYESRKIKIEKLKEVRRKLEAARDRFS